MSIGFFGFSLAACGDMDSAESGNVVSQSVSDATHADFVVLHGGFNSCGGTAQNQVDPRVAGNGLIFSMLKYADKVGDRPYIVTCYPFWTNDPGAKLATPLDNKIYWVERLSGSGAPSEPKEAKISEFFERLPGLANGVNAKNVAVIGHSYGGWTAMLSARKLEESKLHLSQLVTLDPISMVQCNPAVFMNQIQTTSPAEGCTRAPTNDGYLSDGLVRAVASETRWTNYFQTKDKWLHSGPITGVGSIANIPVNFAGTNTDGVANHVAFVTSGELVERVIGLIH
jgi:hypothetical protein